MSSVQLKIATATLKDFVRDKKTESLLKKIGSLFDGQAKVKDAVTLIEKSRFLIKEEHELASQIQKVVNDYNSCIQKKKKRLIPPTFRFYTQTESYKSIQQEDLRLMRKVRVTNLPKHLLPKYQIAANAFEPLPGEVIVFTDSSHLIRSQQTGYPDPALLPYTIPECFLPQNYQLMQKKAEIAEGLLPKGKYNAQAKLLYALQKDKVQMAQEYREVNLAFEHLFNYQELGKPLPQEQILTTPAARALFNRLLTQDRRQLAKIATFQQLYFYKLLCIKLSREILEKEMQNYFNCMSQI